LFYLLFFPTRRSSDLLCFLHSLMQCLASLKCIDEFIKTMLPSDARFLQMLQFELKLLAKGPDGFEMYHLPRVFVDAIYKLLGERSEEHTSELQSRFEL